MKCQDFKTDYRTDSKFSILKKYETRVRSQVSCWLCLLVKEVDTAFRSICFGCLRRRVVVGIAAFIGIILRFGLLFILSEVVCGIQDDHDHDQNDQGSLQKILHVLSPLSDHFHRIQNQQQFIEQRSVADTADTHMIH